MKRCDTYRQKIIELAFQSKDNTKKQIAKTLQLNEGTFLRYVKSYNDETLNKRLEENRKYVVSRKSTENNIKSWKNKETADKRKKGSQHTKLNGRTPEEIYNTDIRPLLYKGMSAFAIEKSSKETLSGPTIRKYTNLYGSEEEIELLKKNASVGRGMSGRSRKGISSPLKGKTYEEILGSKKAADKRAKQTSKWMKENNWNPRKFCQKISKPQKMLFEIIKEKYPEAILEYEYTRDNQCSIFLDIAIPSKRINIEYDGLYWHQKNNQKNINRSTLTDNQRDSLLKENGWKIYRFQYSKSPSKEILVAKAKEYGII